MNGPDYIARASQILLQLRKLDADVRSDVESRTSSKTQCAARIAEIQGEIDQLTSQGLMKRILAHSETGEREQEIKGFKRSIAAEDRALDKDKVQSQDIWRRRTFFEEKVFNLMRLQMKETANHEIGQSLKELWDKVDGNTYFTEAMGRAYIESTVVPAFDRVIEERERHEREHNQYYYGRRIDKNLERELIALLEGHLRERTDASREQVQKMISELPSEITSVCQPLVGNVGYYGLQDDARNIVSSLFVQYGIDTVGAGVKHFDETRAKMKAAATPKEADDLVHGKIMSDYHLSYPNSFDELPYFTKWQISIGHFDPDKLPNMLLWSVARNVPLVRQGFAGTVETFDRKCKETILKKSLTDSEGSFIDNLYYYPNPDSVKTLVLLAASDFANYRTVHATWALEKLAQRSDWQKILEEAEEKYPELKQVRPFLEHWKSNQYEPDAESLRGATVDLAISLIKNEADNGLQSRLAEQALTSEKLLVLLEQRNKVRVEDINLLRRVNEMIASGEINDYNFKQLVRGSLLEVVRLSRAEGTDIGDLLAVAKSTSDNRLAAVLTISEKALEVKGDASALHYLTSASVVEKAQASIDNRNQKGIQPADMDIFLSAYKDLPKMSHHQQILGAFCEFFKGQETIEFYKELYKQYGNENEDFIATIARLVGKKGLTPERAIALSTPIKTERGEVNFMTMGYDYRRIALSYPRFFLETDDGLDFLDHVNKTKGIDGLDPELDRLVGEKALNDKTNSQQGLGHEVLNLEISAKISPLFEEGGVPTLDETNWKGLMAAFITIMEGDRFGQVRQALGSHVEEVKKIFETGNAKDICLTEMKKMWVGYLDGGDSEKFPVSLTYLNGLIKNAGGAGPLSQAEALSTFTQAYAEMLTRKETTARTKGEIANGCASAEKRFVNERWSNEEVSDFYNISRDVIGAAPSLFSAYFNLFEKLKPREFKEFSEELFPLHRVLLSLSEKRDRSGVTTHNSRDLVRMRNSIAGLIDDSGRLKPVEAHRKELTGRVLEMFKGKFGIVKIPENLTADHIRALSDYSMYLANLSGRDAQKEDVLSFYLALAMNDKWDDYRRGAEINPEEYLASEKAARLRTYLENRATLNPVTPENLGIAAEKLPEFMKTLEEESESVAIGNVETVDIKLNNVITNLRGLEDPDLYPDVMDKKRMQLLIEYGNKKVGAVAAKLYQSLAKPGKQPELSAEEIEIRKQIEAALGENSLEATAENVKKYFQDEIKPLTVVANILHFVEEIGVDKEISELREILRPSDEIVAVFNKMGEEFKPTSGAIAISQDLAYLDNLIVKRSAELSEAEVNLVKDYLAKVRAKLAVLEDIYDLVGKKFASMRQGQTETKNELLRGKLEDISKIINQPESQHMIVSTMTHNLPYIIENIRECLSCVRQGANNDTNLTFGDPNKFYLSSKSEMKAGSISDELVFFEPVTFSDRGREMSFVLDRVYGTNTPAILVNQVEAVYKKYAKIKREFPDAKVSIFVTGAATQTGGLSVKLLAEKLQEKIGGKARIEEVIGAEVDVAQSAAGDHYIEFGGDARTAGVRQVSGLSIRL